MQARTKKTKKKNAGALSLEDGSSLKIRIQRHVVCILVQLLKSLVALPDRLRKIAAAVWGDDGLDEGLRE